MRDKPSSATGSALFNAAGDEPSSMSELTNADTVPSYPPGEPESASNLLEGQVVGDRYRIVKLIGRGGMGMVFEATDIQTNGRVAVKTTRLARAENRDVVERFLREVQAVAALKSEHVAKFHDAGWSAEGTPYMAMELLAGDSFHELVEKHGPLPVETAVGYIVEACDAIAEAHALGIVHRDLKPSNLFLAVSSEKRPTVKVLDFGISKLLSADLSQWTASRDLTGTNTSLGTPAYMSPEQLRDAKRVDARTDIWALGMILYQLLTATSAFEAHSLGQFITLVARASPKPLRQCRPDAPDALESVILRCLQKDPARRFQNIGQLVRALAPMAPAVAAVVLPRVAAIVGDEAMARPLPPLEEDRASQASSSATGATGVTSANGATVTVGEGTGPAALSRKAGLRLALGLGALIALLMGVAFILYRSSP